MKKAKIIFYTGCCLFTAWSLLIWGKSCAVKFRDSNRLVESSTNKLQSTELTAGMWKVSTNRIVSNGVWSTTNDLGGGTFFYPTNFMPSKAGGVWAKSEAYALGVNNALEQLVSLHRAGTLVISNGSWFKSIEQITNNVGALLIGVESKK